MFKPFTTKTTNADSLSFNVMITHLVSWRSASHLSRPTPLGFRSAWIPRVVATRRNEFWQRLADESRGCEKAIVASLLKQVQFTNRIGSLAGGPEGSEWHSDDVRRSWP